MATTPPVPFDPLFVPLPSTTGNNVQSFTATGNVSVFVANNLLLSNSSVYGNVYGTGNIWYSPSIINLPIDIYVNGNIQSNNYTIGNLVPLTVTFNTPPANTSNVTINITTYSRDTSTNAYTGDIGSWDIDFIPAFANISNVPVSVTTVVDTFPYEIVIPGDTDFTQIGAANNNANTQFFATNISYATGTGTVVDLKIVRDPSTNAFNTTSGAFDFSNIVFTPATVVGAVVGVPYTQEITIEGGYAPYGNITISFGSLPANLSLSATTNNSTSNTATANITGTPTTYQTANFTLQNIDALSNTTSITTTQDYSLAVEYPIITISPSTLSNAVVGNTYTETFTANGGTGPYTYSNVGNLPPSITLTSATGIITGTITSNTTPANFTIVATDSYNSTGNSAYTLNIAQPTITVAPSTLSNGSVGTAYTATITATGGIAPYTFALSGSLPANLVLNSTTGNITGTPTANGTSTFSITAYDLYNSHGNQSYTVGVVSPTITVTPLTIPDGVVGVSYSQTITATGGVAPYTWTTNNPPPTGVSLSGNTAVGNVGTVTFSGIPSADGVYNFGIVAIDSYNTQGIGNTYVVNMALPTITVSPTSLSNAVTGAAYTANITASGGTGAYTFSVTGNTLPNNLTLAANTGVLSGVVAADGTDYFTITAYDEYNSPGSRNYSITTIDPTILISVVGSTANVPFANGVVGVAYSNIFNSTGGTGPYTYSVTGGALPANVSLSSSGNLTGTPTTAGTSNFTVTSTDAFLSTGSYNYTNIGITLPTIILDPNTLPETFVNDSYSETIRGFGGTDPYTFAVTDGVLPTGLSLNSNTGNITGNTTVASTFNFTITATDAYNSTGYEPYTILVKPPDISITPTTLANAVSNVFYTQTFSATGGTSPHTFAIDTVPAGMSINANTGVFSGTPVVIGNQPFTLTAYDDEGYTGTQEYNFVVAPNVPTSAIEVYVGGIRQTSGYTVTSKSPATIDFDTAPPAGVDVTILVRQGVSWYQSTPYSASDGAPLQETNTPPARFLRGVN